MTPRRGVGAGTMIGVGAAALLLVGGDCVSHQVIFPTDSDSTGVADTTTTPPDTTITSPPDTTDCGPPGPPCPDIPPGQDKKGKK